jgi:anti-sigma-K factor RskA
MRCQEIERLLPDYSVGLLKPRQAEAVASHLGYCSDCGREWKRLQGVMSLVEALGAREPPPGLWNGVYNRITQEVPEPAPPSVWRRLWTRPAGAIGSAVAAAALAAALWMSGSPAGFEPVSPEQADRELVVAVREHALASADALFADRAGLESLAVLASRQ